MRKKSLKVKAFNTSQVIMLHLRTSKFGHDMMRMVNRILNNPWHSVKH